MVAQQNGAGPPLATQEVGPAACMAAPNVANLAAPAAPSAVPNTANLAAPVVAPHIIIANLAGARGPPGGEFDFQAGLLGFPLNIGCEISCHGLMKNDHEVDLRGNRRT